MNIEYLSLRLQEHRDAVSNILSRVSGADKRDMELIQLQQREIITQFSYLVCNTEDLYGCNLLNKCKEKGVLYD